MVSSKSSEETFVKYLDTFPATVQKLAIGCFVGNKAKGRISKRVLQENITRQIFQKTNISYPPDTHTPACAYQRVRNVRFSENLACFVFFSCNIRFDIHPLALLPMILSSFLLELINC